MIVYQLACERDHYFEGWFASAQACEDQAASGRLQCPSCGMQSIRKIPAAPHVHTSGARAPTAADEPRLRARVKSEIAALVRRHIVENTEDVGGDFAEVARRIHYREEEERAIRGQATLTEALELHEEGIDARILPPDAFPPDKVH
jgi:hypothetical protein